MKNLKIQLVTAFIALTTLMSFIVPWTLVNANERNIEQPYKEESILVRPPSLIEQEQKEFLEQEFHKKYNSLLRVPAYVNMSTTVVSTKYATISGFAGGQPAGGTRFKTGGGFVYNQGGGPVLSMSVNVSGTYVGVSANLGTAKSTGVSGYNISVPNKTKYFKCFVSKKYRIQKVAIYGTPYMYPNQKQFLYYTYTKVLYSQEIYAKAV